MTPIRPQPRIVAGIPRCSHGAPIWACTAEPQPAPPLDVDDLANPTHGTTGHLALAAQPAPPLDAERLRDALEDMVRQFAYWSDSAGGVGTGGLSTLEYAFGVLGWDDPHPLPDRRCDEPGCMKDGTMGWPTRPGGTGPNGGYRRTCWDHSAIGIERASALSEPKS